MKTLQVFLLVINVLHAVEGVRNRDATATDSSLTTSGNSASIRLVGTLANRGRVEVLHSGVWGSICDDSFDNSAAKVVCSMLGYPRSGIAISSNNNGTGPIWLDEVKCSGSESDLFLECSHSSWGYSDCSHTEDVGVECFGTQTPQNQQQFRLVGETVNAGRIEVYHEGQWGTICDDSFGRPEGEVACRMFGYSPLLRMSFYGKGNGSILLDDLNCVGNESSLLECGHSAWAVNNCGHDEDTGVECAYKTNDTDYKPILTESSLNSVGRLMIAYRGLERFVCTDAMNATTAETICGMLGYHTSNDHDARITDGTFGQVTGNPVISSISCQGDETLLEQCSIMTSSNCTSGHTYALGLSCLESRVRLVDGQGKWSGRLEIEVNGTYGTVCMRNFDRSEGDVVCTSIFKNSGVTVEGYNMENEFPSGNLPIKLGYLDCSFGDDDLAHCAMFYKPQSQYFKDHCDHSTDVGVQCRAYVPVRLADGNYSGEGRVEMQVNGRWGSPCSVSASDAKVICRMIGYWNSAPVVRGSGYFGSGSGEHVVARLNCDGSEPDVGVCQWDNSSSVCNSRHDMGVSCHTADLSSSDIRLVGDHRPWRGKVLVRPYGVWGSLYYYGTHDNSLQLICRALGFRWVGIPYFYSTYLRGNFVVVPSINCKGTENNIGHCMSTGYGYPAESIYLNVDCIGDYPQVRLVDGRHPLEGRVEIRQDYVWGTVCDSGWGTTDTTVLCRSLGFEITVRFLGFGNVPEAYPLVAGSFPVACVISLITGNLPDTNRSTSTIYYYNAHFGKGTGPVHFTNMDCQGSEYHIAQCQSQNGSSCSHSEDISVLCSNCVHMYSVETGSTNSSVSDGDCFYIIKPGNGTYKLKVTTTERLSGYGHSVQIRREPTGKFLGELEKAGTMFTASDEFWVHYKAQESSYSTLKLEWSPLQVEDAITVDCTAEKWSVSVNVTLLNMLNGTDHDKIFLGNCSSPSRFDSSSSRLDDGTLYLTPTLSDCNTANDISGDIVSYENILAYRTTSGLNVTSERWNFRVQCRLSYNSSSHINGSQSVISSTVLPKTHVAMFTDPFYFRAPVTDGMRIKTGQTVYVKVTMSSSNPNDKMVVRNCYAKPSEGASKSQAHTLIDKGCVMDLDTHIDTTTDTETRFHFNMFAFKGERSHVHVYCDTTYCDKADDSIVCRQGCHNH